jgi:hypothetical protein
MYLFEEKSVVEWCEAHTDRYAISPYISEMTNTLSNLSFLYVAYLLSFYKHQHPLFWQCNCVLVCVGLGSAIFHATETFVGEIADELPMSILMYYYLAIVCHIRKWRFPRAVYLGTATLGWSLYLMYRQHVIFLTLFSCQLAIPVYITLEGTYGSLPNPPCSCVKVVDKRVVFNGREPTVSLATLPNESRGVAGGAAAPLLCLCFAFASIVFGKACWLFERYLYTYQICPEMSSPLYLLHSFWHLGAAFGHYWIMRCWMS